VGIYQNTNERHKINHIAPRKKLQIDRLIAWMKKKITIRII